MTLTGKNLSKISQQASLNAAKALFQLSRRKTKVVVREAKVLTLAEAARSILPARESMIGFTQPFVGKQEGISLLVLGRKEALQLVDLLLGKIIGSTLVMNALDRSALSELTNILVNSFLNALSGELGITVNAGAPTFSTSQKIKTQLEIIKVSKGEGVLFKTVIEITEHQIRTELYFLFLGIM